MPNAAPFEEHREHLVMLGYRMLGTVAEAEDIAQETYLRWSQAGEPELQSPRAWLTRTCTHLCIDQIKAARRDRETYVGEWLPEPIMKSGDDDEVDDSLSMALLVAIQCLKPTERAAFLLHDVFGYDFNEVGSILGRESASCRQLAVRARKRLAERETSPAAPKETDPQTISRVTDAFFEAVRSGELDGIRAILTEDAVLHSDGGGKVAAVIRPVEGGDAVARFLEGIFRKRRHLLDTEDLWINGAPGKLLRDGDEPATVFQIEVTGGLVSAIYAQRNPDKLTGFTEAQ